MYNEISYPLASQIGQSTAVALSTTEATILTITDLKHFKRSQLTTFLEVDLGGAASVNIRYYMSPDGGTTYFQVPLKTTSTGILSDTPTVLGSTTPANGGYVRVIEDIPLSGTTALKITGQTNTSTASVTRCIVYGRDN